MGLKSKSERASLILTC